MRPTGYYILIEMETVEQTITEGALKDFVLHSPDENQREQTGHDVGVIKDFGPTVFTGFAGIPEEKGNTTFSNIDRAEMWGCKVGDKVEFNRYDGKVPRMEGYENYRIIQDQHIIAVIED